MPDLLDDVCQHPQIKRTNLYDDPVPVNMVRTDGGDPEAARPTVVGDSKTDSSDVLLLQHKPHVRANPPYVEYH